MEATDEEAAVVFGDEFVADEILARLPARCAARCTVLSKRFRQLVASSHFWLRHRHIGPPPELPHIARLYCHDDSCTLFEFHVTGAAKLEHTFDAKRCWYAGTCNGLVLLRSTSVSYDGASPSVDGVLFNPATKEEARLSLPLPLNTSVKRRILGFGYGASTKVYKALVGELDQGYTRFMAVSLDGSDDGQEPRTVFSCHDDYMYCRQKLHTADGKVYFLIFTEQVINPDDIFEPEGWIVTFVLVFDVDAEVATTVAIPEVEDQDIFDFTTMLEIRGRPCICKRNDDDTVIWLLTPDHRWEQLYILVSENFHPDGYFEGAWDVAGGLVFTVFDIDGAYLYKLHEHAVEDKEGGGNSLADLSSITVDYKWPEEFGDTPWTLLDYRPTLISPASVVRDVALC